MANSKIIVIEGAQGAGKTTITDYLRNSVKHTNLYRLSGISDSTKAGLQKSKKMYEDLNEYIKKMENLNINLLFDRTFFSEENYCRLGFKDYSFTEVYNKLLDDFSKLDFETTNYVDISAMRWYNTTVTLKYVNKQEVYYGN